MCDLDMEEVAKEHKMMLYDDYLNEVDKDKLAIAINKGFDAKSCRKDL